MNYNKSSTSKKQKKLVGKANKNKRKVSVSLFKVFLVCLLGMFTTGIGAGLGCAKGILDNTPDMSVFDVEPEGFQTTIYNQNGEVITTLSTTNSKRVYVEYEEIPDNLKNAFVSIEDERFWQHNGIDVKGILRAGVSGVKQGFHFSEGASTITQQLIKNQIFNVGLGESKLDSVERKLQEQYLAIELEKKLDKEDILEYYLNSIYLGQGTHGVQAATTTYFNKDMSELTISECAVIAAITQNPSKFDPTAFPEKNKERQTKVLKNMLKQGYITQEQYDEAINDDVYSRIQLTHEEDLANRSYNSYFIDSVIETLTDQLMEEQGYTESQAYNAVYAGGLSIYITQDAGIQQIVDDAINDDANYPQGTNVALSYALTTTDENGENTTNYSSNHLLKYFKEKTGNDKYNLIYPNEEAARADADEFKQHILDETGTKELAESFSVTIQPQASFVIMDQKTGFIKAIAGGRGEKVGNLTLNRATDSARQPGSTFKVLASFAPALDTAGKTLATTYEDAPYTYDNGRSIKNWYNGYRGWASIRDGIRDSMNIVAVKCLTDITPQVGYDYLINLGFTTLVDQRVTSDGMIISDINQSLALGGLTNGVTNLEITAAYASIANSGTYVEPIFYSKVLDHDGNILIDNTPETRQVMKDTTAWLINSAMQDVVTSGTGTPARLASGMPVAGKTGTTSNEYDFWFCGSTPYYTASIWMGYDVNTEFTCGSYHKQMWSKIMNAVVEYEGQDVTATFPQPEGITAATVCKKSGLLPSDKCTETRTEYFAVGTVPSETCNAHNFVTLCMDSHLVATEYCPNQQTFEYSIDDDGKITLDDETVDFTPPENFTTTTCPLHTTPPAKTVYSISATVIGSGGTISGNTQVEEGDTTTLTITPNPGYTIGEVVVDGISKGNPSAFKFSNVSTNHTITVKFNKTQDTTPTDPANPTTPTDPANPTTPAEPVTYLPYKRFGFKA